MYSYLGVLNIGAGVGCSQKLTENATNWDRIEDARATNKFWKIQVSIHQAPVIEVDVVFYPCCDVPCKYLFNDRCCSSLLDPNGVNTVVEQVETAMELQLLRRWLHMLFFFSFCGANVLPMFHFPICAPIIGTVYCMHVVVQTPTGLDMR